jgi:hypothetical protein
MACTYPRQKPKNPPDPKGKVFRLRFAGFRPNRGKQSDLIHMLD